MEVDEGSSAERIEGEGKGESEVDRAEKKANDSSNAASGSEPCVTADSAGSASASASASAASASSIPMASPAPSPTPGDTQRPADVAAEKVSPEMLEKRRKVERPPHIGRVRDDADRPRVGRRQADLPAGLQQRQPLEGSHQLGCMT